MWGYIPAPGGEDYKSAIMLSVVDKEKTDKMKGGTRAIARSVELQQNKYDRYLDRNADKNGETRKIMIKLVLIIVNKRRRVQLLRIRMLVEE